MATRRNLPLDGVMSVTGFPNGPPVKAGPALADFLSGTHLYAGIVTALYERQFTGVARLVEVAMQEALFPTLASNLTFFYNNGATPPRTGNRHGGLAVAPYNVHAASNGHIAIIGVRDVHWDNLLAAMGREDLRDDPRFATRTARVRHLEETDGLIAGWMKHLTPAQASEILRRRKAPSAPVRDLVEVVNDPHMHGRGMLEWIDHREHGRIVAPGNPIRFHGADGLPGAISARLGAATDAVLADELQMPEAEIAALRAEGVIGPLPEPQVAGAGRASSGK